MSPPDSRLQAREHPLSNEALRCRSPMDQTFARALRARRPTTPPLPESQRELGGYVAWNGKKISGPAWPPIFCSKIRKVAGLAADSTLPRHQQMATVMLLL